MILIPAELQCDFIKFDVVFITIEEEERRKRKSVKEGNCIPSSQLALGGLSGVGSVLEREREREREREGRLDES